MQVNFLLCQVLKQNFYNVADFKVKILQRARFQMENFTTCQILLQCFYNASVFTRDEKIKKTDLDGVFFLEKTVFYPFYSVKTTNLQSWHLRYIIKKTGFQAKVFTSCQFL